MQYITQVLTLAGVPEGDSEDVAGWCITPHIDETGSKATKLGQNCACQTEIYVHERCCPSNTGGFIIDMYSSYIKDVPAQRMSR